MGFDVSGRNPSDPKGRYFRNNVWWWHPLWDYCCSVSKDAASVKYGHSNDGDGLGSAGAKRLADELFRRLDSGHTAQYAVAYEARLAAIPDKACSICHGTGVRTDGVGVGMEQDKKVIDEPGHPRHGQTGWCNGCNGTGRTKDYETMYPFSVENVREFAEFVKHSGGFEIF